MSAEQKEIDLFNWMSRAVEPAQSVAQPRFWISDLMLLRHLKDDGAEIIRHFRLRRGLNILWAKPFDPDQEANSTDEAVSGHAAGKTLFCRIIRYLLGERHLGNELLQERITANLPDGWAVGTVYLEEVPWLVARRFASKHGQFCVRGLTSEEWLESPTKKGAHFDQFQDALNAAVTGPLRVNEFPDRGGTIHLQHILPWLTRDQEARYGSLAQWRDPSSGAEPMATDSEDRHFLIRATLGLIHEFEKPELDRNATLVRERDHLRGRQPVVEDRINQAMASLRDGLRAAGLENDFIETLSLDDDLLVPSIQTRLNEKIERIRGLLDEIPNLDRVRGLQDTLTQRTEARTRLEEEIRGREKEREKTREDWANLAHGKDKQAGLDHAKSLPLPDGRCNAPISEAARCGCHLWREWSNLKTDETGEPNLEGLDAVMRQRIEAIEAEIARKTEAADDSRKEERRAREELDAANEKRHSLFSTLKAQELRFEGLVDLARKAKDSASESTQCKERLEELDQSIGDSYKKQQQIRELQRTELNHFSEYFDQICKHILGKEVGGRVKGQRRTLDLEISDRGPLTSAAIETIKVLALDLAGLWHRIEGKGHHPGFLLHDGPREADMDPWLYRRLFTFARKLEEAFPSKDTAAFQYIVTTTEPPPQELQQADWTLRPLLSARDPEDRLLKMDLH